MRQAVLCSLALPVLIFGKVGSDTCLATVEELNSEHTQGDLLQSNFEELMEITMARRLSYQVGKVNICTTGDGQMIRGLGFGLDPYERADAEALDKQVDINKMNHIDLSFLGLRKGNCHAFQVEAGDFIKEITVKHSKFGINFVEFLTDQGQTKAVGSDQSDTKNEFDWTVTKVNLEEHERFQGAYGHVEKVEGEVRLRSLGFFKNDCWYGEVPKPPTWVVLAEQREAEQEAQQELEQPLKHLNFDKLETSDVKVLQSFTSAPTSDEIIKEETYMGLAIVILLTIGVCCCCCYFIAQKRGSCFKKLSAEDRQEKLPDQSQRNNDLDLTDIRGTALEMSEKKLDDDSHI